MGSAEVGTGTEWNNSSSECISSALGVSVAEDMGFDHEYPSSHVSNGEFTKWGVGGVWDKNDWAEIFAINPFGMDAHFGNNGVSTSAGGSIKYEAEPSLTSSNPTSVPHFEPTQADSEQLQSGFELGHSSFWMTDADSQLDMNIDPSEVDIMALLADYPITREATESSRNSSPRDSIKLDSEYPSLFESEADVPLQSLATRPHHPHQHRRTGRSERAPTRNRAPRPTYQFLCGINGCSRSYKRRYDLIRHQTIHSDVRKHACRFAMCDRGGSNGFARRDHLRQHWRQVHGVSN